MSFMRGNLLTKTTKLVKGQAKREPLWLKAMQQSPPVVFPQPPGEKVKNISMPEDKYVKKFNAKYPDSLYHDAIWINGFAPPPSRVFAWRVLELKVQGVGEDEAMAVAEMEYKEELKDKKNAYRQLKQICRKQGKRPPLNPFPSAIKEIQAEEIKYVRDRFTNPKTLELVWKMREEKALEMQMNKSRDLDF